MKSGGTLSSVGLGWKVRGIVVKQITDRNFINNILI